VLGENMSTRNRYQEGSLEKLRRAKGPDVWIYRWRELQPDGARVQRKRVIGDIQRLKTLADAKREVENFRAEINTPQAISGVTVRELWGHFQAHELRDPDVDRSPTTIDLYLNNMRAHIIPRWGDCSLEDVKPVQVEQWLRSLPCAPATKNKFRNQMSALFSHAIRHELWDKENPLKTVRQGSKRITTPDILTLSETRALLARIDSSAIRNAVLVAAVTGLRRSEIRGLKWSDVDTGKLWLRLVRGIVGTKETKLKTEGSRRGVPIPQDLADALIQWREESLYQADEDWVFASPGTKGKSPLWFDVALRRILKPAAKTAGINKIIGWHTFRRSLATLLATKGENVKVVQELLRHAHSCTTLELYQQADTDAKRAAQGHTSELFVMPATAAS
jgi:integrase